MEQAQNDGQEDSPIVFGADPLTAAIMALGYGSIVWSIYLDINWLGWVSLFLGYLGLSRVSLPTQPPYQGYAYGVLVLTVIASILGLSVIYHSPSMFYPQTIWGNLLIQAQVSGALYLVLRKLLPVQVSSP